MADDPNLLQDYLDSDPRKLSPESVKKAAKVLGIPVGKAKKIIAQIGKGWDDNIDPNSL